MKELHDSSYCGHVGYHTAQYNVQQAFIEGEVQNLEQAGHESSSLFETLLGHQKLQVLSRNLLAHTHIHTSVAAISVHDHAPWAAVCLIL